MAPVLESPSSLDPEQRAAVRALAAEVEARDGQPPLSDQALSRLDSPAALHRVVRDGDRVTGYAQLDGTSLEVAAEATAVLVLMDAVDAVGPAGLLVWSHGIRSLLVAALECRGYRRERVLLQLRRDLADPPPPLSLPRGVEIRPFAVGIDEDAWLRVNAEAFAGHAEQGGWTRADLAAREAQPWFDAAGFLLAARAQRLLGFHWTKIHPDGTGEVYVLGVSPAAQGTGLGAVLLAEGLRYLASRGCPAALLYVDESNASALRLYERSGFRRHDVDVQWRAPSRPR
jgi:mycothiol synthase